MSEKVLEKEIEKIDNLITSANNELDGAKQTKAPRSTVKHLEERVKALETRKKRFEKALTNFKKQSKSEGQSEDTEKAAAPSGKKGEKKEGD